MRKLLLILSLISIINLNAQELNCELVINAEQTGNENLQIFKTLQRQLKEFVNNTKWTGKKFLQQERIDCSMFINILEQDNDKFKATIQVLSSRPVFNSSYNTPVYNFNDKDFDFQYLEYQNLNYSPTQYQSNLVSVIAFHVYMILGLDADTFSLNGGDKYYDQARAIVGYSQLESSKGWEPPKGGDQTRSQLINNIMSKTYKEFRSVMYQYHRNALDIMHEDQKKAKERIANSVDQFFTMNNRRPNSFILRVFFDAKAEEIQEIFSNGPSVNISQFVGNLNRIAPLHASKWRTIKF
ncbi:MAG: DUF4835 family protein [Flavobacteriaceae bacterium]|nr:DUF4835 family protein [Flavobacteriaceae bacterium]